ncbi:MAG: hypothetical protein LC109_13620 [Bacteroidia bacterium]|nr:hypothetical protein [Bacteroidia bacterium]
MFKIFLKIHSLFYLSAMYETELNLNGQYYKKSANKDDNFMSKVSFENPNFIT